MIKRIRPENKTAESSGGEVNHTNDLDRLKPAEQTAERNIAAPTRRNEQVVSTADESSRLAGTHSLSRPSTPNVSAVRTFENSQLQVARSTNGNYSTDMPPPSNSMNRTIVNDQRGLALPDDAQPQAMLPRTPSSPTTRPGTRNVSADSRASIPVDGMSRGDHDPSDDRRLHSDLQSRTDRGHVGHRDVIHGRSERNGRDRREPLRERDVEHERDTERDKEKQRDRERERDRDRDRPRERDREREKDRDRHRREEKDRERDQRKDRDAQLRSSASTSKNLTAEEQNSLSRQDTSRHRSGHAATADDTLGKRRRPADDDVSYKKVEQSFKY